MGRQPGAVAAADPAVRQSRPTPCFMLSFLAFILSTAYILLIRTKLVLIMIIIRNAGPAPQQISGGRGVTAARLKMTQA